MGRMNLYGMMEEIQVFLTNNLTDPRSRASTATYSGTATASQTVITISVAGINAITSVTIAGALKTFGTDYTVAYGAASCVITMTSAMSVGNSISIPYKYGTKWIYPDWAKESLSQASYPRVSLLWGNIITTPSGLGAAGNFNDIIISITVFSESVKETMQIADEIRDDIAGNKKGFYNFAFIDLAGVGPILTAPERKGEITYCALTFRIPLKYETNS